MTALKAKQPEAEPVRITAGLDAGFTMMEPARIHNTTARGVRMNVPQKVLTIVALAVFTSYGLMFLCDAPFPSLRNLIVIWFLVMVIYLGLFFVCKRAE